jgi:SAM-dependent methyltransferase
MNVKAIREFYDSAYHKDNYFSYQSLVYKAFVSAIIDKTRLPKFSSILDVGCGQGHLSYYIACRNMNVYCTDISLVGLRSLNRYDELFKHKRILADILQHPFRDVFDMVISRSCTLHNEYFKGNTVDFVSSMIDCAKPGGIVCVIYNSNLTSTGTAWFNPTFDAFRKSIEGFPLAELKFFVINKIDTLLLGEAGINRSMTRLNIALARVFRRKYELVAIGKKTRSNWPSMYIG